MKKKTLLLFTFIACGGILNAQENYILDSKIILLLKEDLIKFKITLDANGNLPVTSGINIAPYEVLVKKLKAEDPYTPRPVPAQGALLDADKHAVLVGGDDAMLVAIQKKELERELIAVAWLLQTDNDKELLRVKNFPSTFPNLNALKKSLPTYVGQSTNKETAFAFNETAIIYGITDFVIRRAKEQLVETYLREWYEKLKRHDIIAPVIPQSLDVTKAFMADNSLNLAKYGDKWKVAIREDFHHLPELLQQESYLKKLIAKFNSSLSSGTQSEIIAAIAGSANLAQRLYTKEHFVAGIRAMSVKYLAGGDRKMFKRLTVLADVLLKVGGTLEKNDIYQTIELDALDKLRPEEWSILLKLTYTRNPSDLKFAMDSDGAGTDLNGTASLILNQFRMLLTEVVVLAQDFQKIVGSDFSELKMADARKIFEIAFRLYPVCKEFLVKNSMNMNASNYEEQVQKYFQFAVEMGEGVATQEYGKVLDGTIGVMNQLKNNRNDQVLETITNQLQRYGSFLLNILSAKEANEVEAAINELVPKESYMVKNTKRFTLSLSAHPGVLVGLETVKKYPVDNNGSIIPGENKQSFYSFSAAPYLPIGIDFSFHPLSKEKLKERAKKNKLGSMNIGIQLVDLGAVLNYRLNSDTTVNSSPELGFKQFFSPGMQVMWHFNNSPVVIGAACNYTPDLRKISQEGYSYRSNALRYGIFLAVDVTFFHFFTSKKDSWDD